MAVDVDGLAINGEPFVEKSKGVLEKATQQKLSIDYIRSSGRTFCDFRLQGEGITDNAYEPLPVILLKVDGSQGILWLGVRLTCNNSLTRLRHIQLRLVTGELTGIKPCLLRMEWDPREIAAEAGSDEKKHAQPHWQVDATQSIGAFESFQSSTSPQLGLNRYSANIGRLHLAMISNFHQRKPIWRVPDKDITPDAILNWMRGTIDYMLMQLRYVTRKTGS